MLSEKNQAAVIAVFGHPIMLDEEGQDWNALLDYVRHQAQDEAKAVSVEGWKLVPVEPTEAMIDAPRRIILDDRMRCSNGRTKAGVAIDIYNAMIAASPHPPRDERPVAQCGGDAIAAMLEEDPFTIAPYRQAVGATAALAKANADAVILDQIAIVGALHRWLEWDHVGAEDDYRTGAAFIHESLATVRDGAERMSIAAGATASTTPDTGTEKVAAQVEQPIREAINPQDEDITYPPPTPMALELMQKFRENQANQHTRDRIAELEVTDAMVQVATREINEDGGCDLGHVDEDMVRRGLVAAFWVGLTLDALVDRQPLYATPPKPPEATAVAEGWEAEAKRLWRAWRAEMDAATTPGSFHRYAGGADALLVLMKNMGVSAPALAAAPDSQGGAS